MKAKWLAPIAVVAMVFGSLVLLRVTSRGDPLRDYACPTGTPVMAFNVVAGVNPGDIAVLAGNGEVRRLTDDRASWDPSFSPDGTEVVFTKGEGAYSDSLGFESTAIYVMGSDGSEQRPLLDELPVTTFAGAYGGRNPADSIPRWSPDGETIAFVRNDQQLILAPLDGGEPRLLYEDDSRSINGIAWSADSSKIAVTSEGRRGKSIFVVEADNGELVTRIPDVGADGDVAWSPAGATLAFEAHPAIHTIPVDDPEEAEIFVRAGYAPAWSPAGTDIAYISEDGRLFRNAVTSGDEVEIDVDDATLTTGQADLAWLRCPPA